MLFSYRWLWALCMMLVIMGFAFFYDIQPAWQRLSALHQEAASLTQTLSERPLSVAQQKAALLFANESTLLNTLLAMAEESGLHIQSANRVALSSNNEKVFHLITQGDFKALTLFIQQLQTSPFPMLILDFAYQPTKNNTWLFSADVLLYQQGQPIEAEKNTLLFEHKNPFCSPQTFPLPYRHAREALQSQPLARIKMLGFMRDATAVKALLLFPDDSIFLVEKGDKVGKEAAVVANVWRGGVQLILPNKQFFVIRLL